MKTPVLKTTLTMTVTLLAGSMLSTMSLAQQTPATKPATAPAATAKKAPAKSTTPVLTTEKEKASYAIGVSVARRLQQQGLEVEPTVVLQGLKDALAGGTMLLTDQEAQTAINNYQEAQMKAVGEANKKEGAAFLAANKTKEGVTALPDGLQYKVLVQGTGPKPTAADTVECNYRGTLIDGKEFDSSYKRGKPATFPVSGVIKGWTEILQLMPVGSKYQVFIPGELAYGERSVGGDIRPNSTLIFEIELLSIKPAEAKPAPAATKPAGDAKPAETAK